MGYYINPEDRSKESWLKEYAKQVHKNDLNNLKSGEVAVILMDNGAFTAAGIAFCQQELEAFTSPTDHRLKQFFIASKQDIIDVCPPIEEVFTEHQAQ